MSGKLRQILIKVLVFLSDVQLFLFPTYRIRKIINEALKGVLLLWQVISLAGWVNIMYYIQDAHSFWDWIYFVALIIVSATVSELFQLEKVAIDKMTLNVTPCHWQWYQSIYRITLFLSAFCSNNVYRALFSSYSVSICLSYVTIGDLEQSFKSVKHDVTHEQPARRRWTFRSLFQIGRPTAE